MKIDLKLTLAVTLLGLFLNNPTFAEQKSIDDQIKTVRGLYQSDKNTEALSLSLNLYKNIDEYSTTHSIEITNRIVGILKKLERYDEALPFSSKVISLIRDSDFFNTHLHGIMLMNDGFLKKSVGDLSGAILSFEDSFSVLKRTVREGKQDNMPLLIDAAIELSKLYDASDQSEKTANIISDMKSLQ